MDIPNTSPYYQNHIYIYIEKTSEYEYHWNHLDMGPALTTRTSNVSGQADVERLARYFAQRYGGDDRLLEARKALDPEAAARVTLF